LAASSIPVHATTHHYSFLFNLWNFFLYAIKIITQMMCLILYLLNLCHMIYIYIYIYVCFSSYNLDI